MIRLPHWFTHLVRLFRRKAQAGQALRLKKHQQRPTKHRPEPLSPGRPLWQLGGGWAVEVQTGVTYLVCPNRRHYWPLLPVGYLDYYRDLN
jgi:hypothetical protein